jgi:hypothetical protein
VRKMVVRSVLGGWLAVVGLLFTAGPAQAATCFIADTQYYQSCICRYLVNTGSGSGNIGRCNTFTGVYTCFERTSGNWICPSYGALGESGDHPLP